MATNFIQPGDCITVAAPTGGTTAGKAYLIGNLIVIATATIAQTLPVECCVVGVFTVDKATGATWSVGQNIYWDDTAKKFTPTATSNYYAGIALAAAASGDTTGVLRLNGIGVKAAG